MKVASIVVDLRHTRCDNCKVVLHDELATVCPVCEATFDSITSNHAGLAEKVESHREDAGVRFCDVRVADRDEEPVELVSS